MPRKPIPLWRRERIAELYRCGTSSTIIAEEVGCCVGTVMHYAHDAGLPTRGRVPQDAKNTMVASYQTGKSSYDVAKETGYSWATVIKAIREVGLTPRNMSECHRKYSLNENFFDEITSEESAYWLGFITADGCISKDNRLEIGLASRDRNHLEKFLIALESDTPIRDENRFVWGTEYPRSRISVGSRRLCNSLRHLGIDEKKANRVKPCTQIPMFLKRHYWRGLIDGDGWVTICDTGTLKFYLGLCGNQFIVRAFADFIEGKLETHAKPTRVTSNTWHITYGGKRLPTNAVRLLYQDANVYLDRKKSLADMVMQFSENVV